MEAQQLTIEREQTDSLVPYARNAKIHNDTQIDQIAKSIQEFNFNDPVAVWTNAKGESEIIEGHGRVLAAKKLGIVEIPVIHLDSLSDAQRRAYTHVHNQLTMNTGWDFDTLEADFDALDFDFAEFGFDSVSIDGFGTDFTLDDADEPQYKTITLLCCAQDFDDICEALDMIGALDGNGNKNGKAVAEVCRQWLLQKTSS